MLAHKIYHYQKIYTEVVLLIKITSVFEWGIDKK